MGYPNAQRSEPKFRNTRMGLKSLNPKTRNSLDLNQTRMDTEWSNENYKKKSWV